jgi:hypothetical protein
VLFKQADREGLTGRTGLAGWTGEKGEQAEFLDIIIDKIEVRRRGRIRCTNVAFKKRKLPQASLRPFRFLTANPGKP